MATGDGRAIAAQPRERDMRPKRPVLAATEGVEERRAQPRELVRGGAFRPEQAWPLRLGSIVETHELQRKGTKIDNRAAQYFGRRGERALVPRRDEREMNISLGDAFHRRALQHPPHMRQFASDLR